MMNWLTPLTGRNLTGTDQGNTPHALLAINCNRSLAPADVRVSPICSFVPVKTLPMLTV